MVRVISFGGFPKVHRMQRTQIISMIPPSTLQGWAAFPLGQAPPKSSNKLLLVSWSNGTQKRGWWYKQKLPPCKPLMMYICHPGQHLAPERFLPVFPGCFKKQKSNLTVFAPHTSQPVCVLSAINCKVSVPRSVCFFPHIPASLRIERYKL